MGEHPEGRRRRRPARQDPHAGREPHRPRRPRAGQRRPARRRRHQPLGPRRGRARRGLVVPEPPRQHPAASRLRRRVRPDLRARRGHRLPGSPGPVRQRGAEDPRLGIPGRRRSRPPRSSGAPACIPWPAAPAATAPPPSWPQNCPTWASRRARPRSARSSATPAPSPRSGGAGGRPGTLPRPCCATSTCQPPRRKPPDNRRASCRPDPEDHHARPCPVPADR